MKEKTTAAGLRTDHDILILLSWEGRCFSGPLIMQAEDTLGKVGLPSTPLILVSIVVYYVCAWFFFSRNRRLSLPPGPKRAWITGNLHDLPKGMLWLRAAEWAKTYGELALIYQKKSFCSIIVAKRAICVHPGPQSENSLSEFSQSCLRFAYCTVLYILGKTRVLDALHCRQEALCLPDLIFRSEI